MTQKFSYLESFKTIILALVIAVGTSYIFADWSNPPAGTVPPDNNTDAPLNVGSGTQEKSGSLILNTASPIQNVVGLSVFGKSIFNGDVQITTGAGAGKVLMSDADGNASWEELEEEATYNCNLIANTLADTLEGSENNPAKITRWIKTPIPSSCLSDEGCAIKQELYGKRTSGEVYLYRSKRFDYMQTVVSGKGNDKWWSSYDQSGTRINGNTVSTNVIPPRAYSRILLRDDRNTVTYSGFPTYTETSETDWSVYDNSSSWGQKLYVCDAGSGSEG